MAWAGALELALTCFPKQGLRGAEGNLRRECGFAHAWPARQDQQIGWMQAARFGVKIVQSGCQARDVPGAAECTLSALDGIGERPFECDKAGARTPLGCQLKQRVLGCFDLCRRGKLGFGAEGVIDHAFADIDKLTPQPSIVNGAPIFAGVDNSDHRGKKLRQIGGTADLRQHAGMLELGFQRDRIGKLAGLDTTHNGSVNTSVDRIGEMLRGQEIGDAFVRLVVGQHRSEQRLLGLEVGRRQALRETE